MLYLPEKRRMNMNRKVLVRTTGWQSAFIQLLTDYMAAYGYEVTADPEEEMNEVSPGFILYDETSKKRIRDMVRRRLECDSVTFVFCPYQTKWPRFEPHYRLFDHSYFDLDELQSMMVIGTELYFSQHDEDESYNYLRLAPRDRFYLGLQLDDPHPCYFDKPNHAMADEVWRSAAEEDDYNSMMRLKLRDLEDENGRFTSFKWTDIYKALGPYHILTKHRWRMANAMLGQVPSLFNPEEGIKWLIPAALEDKNPLALECLSEAYAAGKWGMPQDYQKSREFYAEALRKGHPHLWINEFMRQKAENPDLTL